jgi:hypothetical protein
MADEADPVELSPGVPVPRRFLAPSVDLTETGMARSTSFAGMVDVVMSDDGQPRFLGVRVPEPMTLDEWNSIDWGEVLRGAVAYAAGQAVIQQFNASGQPWPADLGRVLKTAAGSVQVGKRSYNKLTPAELVRVRQLAEMGPGTKAIEQYFNVGDRQARRMLAMARSAADESSSAPNRKQRQGTR